MRKHQRKIYRFYKGFRENTEGFRTNQNKDGFWLCKIHFYYHLSTDGEFLQHMEQIFFYWSLSDSKFPQIFKTFQIILADFSSAVVLIVLIHFLIPSSIAFSGSWDLFQYF